MKLILLGLLLALSPLYAAEVRTYSFAASYYGENNPLNVPGLSNAAIDMTSFFSRTFPDEQGGHVTMAGKDLNSDAIRSALSELPKDTSQPTLYVIYITGHGIKKVDTASGKASFAVLAPNKDGKTDEISGLSIVDAIRRLPLDNRAIVIVDCCFSGTLEEYEMEFGRKGILIATSRNNEESGANVFSTAISSMETSAFEQCNSPTDWLEVVHAEILRRDQYMTVQLLAGEEVQTCLPLLGKPTSLIMLRFPFGLNDVVNVYVNGNLPVPFAYSQDHRRELTFVVPTGECQIRLEMRGKEISKTTTTLRQSFVVLPQDVPTRYHAFSDINLYKKLNSTTTIPVKDLAGTSVDQQLRILGELNRQFEVSFSEELGRIATATADRRPKKLLRKLATTDGPNARGSVLVGELKSADDGKTFFSSYEKTNDFETLEAASKEMRGKAKSEGEKDYWAEKAKRYREAGDARKASVERTMRAYMDAD